MQLLTVFLIVALSVIAATLIIISIKLTDMVAEAKASRIAVQNMEADDLFRQGHFSEQQSKERRQHNIDILCLLERIEAQLGAKVRTKNPSSNDLAQSEPSLSAVQNRFSNPRL